VNRGHQGVEVAEWCMRDKSCCYAAVFKFCSVHDIAMLQFSLDEVVEHASASVQQ
jgi:hypothetical protein